MKECKGRLVLPLGPVMLSAVGVRAMVTSGGNLMGSRPMCDCARHVEEKERERVVRVVRDDRANMAKSSDELVSASF